MAITSRVLVSVLLFLLQHVLVHSAKEDKKSLAFFKCSYPLQLAFPFTNYTHPDCGLWMVKCTEDAALVQLAEQGYWYNLTRINQLPYQSIQIVDPNLEYNLKNKNCNALNNYSLPRSSPFISLTLYNLTLFKCKPRHVDDRSPEPEEYSKVYLHYDKCPGFIIYYDPSKSDIPAPGIPPQHCSVIQMPRPLDLENSKPTDLFERLTPIITLDYQVTSECLDCHSEGGQCAQNAFSGTFQCNGLKKGNKRKVVILATAFSGAGIGAIIMVLLLCLWRNLRSKRETDQSVEAFIKRYGSLSPKRYRYSEIMKMTNSFKSELGKGGYGSVYKGKLLDGRLVAVKVLDRSKGRGEDFINEIASIGRTSHINIVTLLGFCFEGKKSALIYEFIPNGSLEKFIFAELDSEYRKLGWETLYRIALGIAQGLEYLHRGCNARILHFDIKPHNILLDEDFCPKISDFGLAKLCLKKESIITMSDGRGTPGYVAPELFCRNIGGVSHKSDVYSYGMMVLEMVGGRKNINAGVDHSSQIYFPYWIYKQVELHKEPRLEGITNEEDKQRATKMILVSLWCIQIAPSNRPPMSQVVDFLKGMVEAIPMPPRPFLSSPLGSPPRTTNPS